MQLIFQRNMSLFLYPFCIFKKILIKSHTVTCKSRKKYMNPTHKLENLKTILKKLSRVAVAFSGGVDSSFLLNVAHDCLGDNCIGITAVSPIILKHELESIDEIIKKIGVKHVYINSSEMEDALFLSNDENRCYYCKARKVDAIFDYAQKNGYHYLLDGTNVDDKGDHRPGKKAAIERGVRSPLEEAGFAKTEIRELARQMGLPNWDKPEDACLASRVPYGIKITAENLSQIDRAENLLRKLGLKQLRVRHHGEIARIEIMPDDFATILENRQHLSNEFKKIGFTYITLDLTGFRSGSLNEVI
jgi:uncharacterized protein